MKNSWLKITVAVIVFHIAGYLLVSFVTVRCLEDTYSEVIVPSCQFISYEQLYTCPPEISWENYSWFDDYIEPDTLIELRRYMRENDLYIRPGDYKLQRIKNFDDLKSRLRFVSGEKVATYTTTQPASVP